MSQMQTRRSFIAFILSLLPASLVKTKAEAVESVKSGRLLIAGHEIAEVKEWSIVSIPHDLKNRIL